ncbi:DUF402 domain-containing protein [Psychrobacillus sp. NPDC093200]|uniref:DUF402 domain-containing protein n=1 Tax=Psychrobacillus sp. NPDC093200 TaxID=3390656 RepID=UPI003D041F39
MKRKYGNRSDWSRILKRQYIFKDTFSEQFTGGISLLHLVEIGEPLWVNYDSQKICIVDDGYMWLQQYPNEENYTVTTMFNHNGEVVQWYIDICYRHGVDYNGPWWDDLFLDIIVLPSGDYYLIDEDELEEALLKGQINYQQYNHAKQTADKIMDELKENKFDILKQSKAHKNLLLELLE